MSPTGCRLWKVMLLPSNERYSSSRTCISIFCARSSAPKLRPSCRTPRMICEMATVIARGINTLVSGWGASIALNALPVKTGITAASPAFPIAPEIIIRMIHPCRRACDQIQRTGLVRSYVTGRCMENSAGDVRVVITVHSTIWGCFVKKQRELTSYQNQIPLSEPVTDCVTYLIRSCLVN